MTLTERETMAVLIGRELAAFLLEEHVSLDAAAQPRQASTTCCPKCGQPGTPAERKGDKLPTRTMTTLAGDICMHRQRWRCAKCRVIFFSVRRSVAFGNGRFQPDGAGESGSPGEQVVVVR